MAITKQLILGRFRANGYSIPLMSAQMVAGRPISASQLSRDDTILFNCFKMIFDNLIKNTECAILLIRNGFVMLFNICR